MRKLFEFIRFCWAWRRRIVALDKAESLGKKCAKAGGHFIDNPYLYYLNTTTGETSRPYAMSIRGGQFEESIFREVQYSGIRFYPGQKDKAYAWARGFGKEAWVIMNKGYVPTIPAE